jgi:hypothetical protein
MMITSSVIIMIDHNEQHQRGEDDPAAQFGLSARSRRALT